ncbi:MAG: polysaccharide biosynthesis/export family protein [Acidobacteriaceae bacterium]
MTKFGLIAGLLICAGISCFAQKAPKESLLIGPADSITIQVLEAPELTQHVRVTDAGYVPLIVGGSVKVSGLTPAQASRAVENALKKGNFVLNPHVTITDDQQATQNVTVLGQVKTPGYYPIGTPRSVLDVLALAGGPTDLADRHITIQRHDSDTRIQYFLSNHSNTALDTSVMVYPGDTVIVPQIDVVYVLGDVPRPGGYPMATNDGTLSLLQAVSLAGSDIPNAVARKTRLLRKQPNGTYVVMQLNLKKMEKGEERDMLLQPNDIVYIPFSYIKNIGTNLGSIVAASGSAAIYRY